MKVNVKALTSFAYGSLDAHAGRDYVMNKGDADELVKKGFVEIVEDDAKTNATDSQTGASGAPPGDTDVDDMVGAEAKADTEAKAAAKPKK